VKDLGFGTTPWGKEVLAVGWQRMVTETLPAIEIIRFQNPILVIIGRVLQGLLWLVAIWLILWNVLRWWPGERWWPVPTVNYFAPWVALAVLPLIGLTWLVGQRALSLAFLIAALLIGIHLALHSFFKPSPPTTAFPLKVMAYSVHRRTKVSGPIVACILEQDADIVALQELTPALSEQLVQALEGQYPYHTLERCRSRRGQGLLSCYPLEQLSGGSDYRYQLAVVQTPDGADHIAQHPYPISPIPLAGRKTGSDNEISCRRWPARSPARKGWSSW
jgi:hypothetical protein